MALPSEDEAFGVAYVEALACGVPAIGCAGEGGPEEIAALGDGMLLVPPRDPARARATTIRAALADPELPGAARAAPRPSTSAGSAAAATPSPPTAMLWPVEARRPRHRRRLRPPRRAVPHPREREQVEILAWDDPGPFGCRELTQRRPRGASRPAATAR